MMRVMKCARMPPPASRPCSTPAMRLKLPATPTQGSTVTTQEIDPHIDALIRELLAGVQAALGEQFVGLYLHGSLANGDFAPGRSDIDFLVVTESELTQ